MKTTHCERIDTLGIDENRLLRNWTLGNWKNKVMKVNCSSDNMELEVETYYRGLVFDLLEKSSASINDTVNIPEMQN